MLRTEEYMATDEMKATLAATIEQIFDDGVMDGLERKELKEIYSQGDFTVSEVREVFASYVAKTWGEVLEDGVIDDIERVKLLEVVKRLNISEDMLPPGVKKAIS
jgi:hypothetical protein